ncbi:uncharacterized protein DUF4102 [Trinickia symbiotica]|nr:uncharacterized protein DUF4102 [Trinickia symbiotica]
MVAPRLCLVGYKIMGQLTDLQVKNAEHRTKEYFLADGDGLYLRVRPTRKVWVYRYMRDGKNIKLKGPIFRRVAKRSEATRYMS